MIRKEFVMKIFKNLFLVVAFMSFSAVAMAAGKIGVIYDVGWMFNPKVLSEQKMYFKQYDKHLSAYVKKNPKLYGEGTMVESSSNCVNAVLAYTAANNIKADAKAPVTSKEAAYAYWRTFDIDDVVKICKKQQWQGAFYFNFSNGFNYKPDNKVDLVGCVFNSGYVDAKNGKFNCILPGASQIAVNSSKKDKDKALYDVNFAYLVVNIIGNLQAAPSYAELVINCDAGNPWINNPLNSDTFVNYHYFKGVILRNYGAYEAALKEADLILKVVPNRREIYNLKWLTYAQMGNQAKAQENKNKFDEMTQELLKNKK